MNRVVCNDTKEVFTDYNEYLKSKHWTALKTRYKESKLYKSGKCVLCGCNNNINIHHKSYKRLGHERLNDLIVLCQSCHKQLHDRYTNKASSHITLWSMTRHMNCLQKRKK